MATLITELGRLRAYLSQIMREAPVASLASRLVQRHGANILDELDDVYDALAAAEFDDIEPDSNIAERLFDLAPRIGAMLGRDDERHVEDAALALTNGDLHSAIGHVTRVIGGIYGELNPEESKEELERMLVRASEEEAQRRRAAFRVV